MNISGIGRLSKEPKMSFTAKGTPQTVINLAVKTGWGDNEKTIWLSLICWGAQAEIINEKFSKGERIEFVADATEIHTYTKSDGEVGSSVDGKLLNFNWVDKSKGVKKEETPFEKPAEETFEWEE